ncbi:protein NRT1/ PTR FAMILY 1.2 isoform X1 [Lactuca sativa]|uniref:protein NRT1/ PTR FAMILY 1.2 isoform X1 n=2 Tax=Lactuca sativa TaxID=4236 RepID=UPI000CBAA607|nr:protein NRT1/ PTR FAMILY 1.2 isoform X1 [Lactuca sativa]
MEGKSNQDKSSIDKELQTKLLLHSDHDDKGGMRTMPFIIVNEAFERVASDGLMPNMIFYLMEVYHMEAVTGTSILSIWSALSNGLSIFGAFIADSYLGRFRVIALGSLSTLVGMIFLWLTSIFPQLRPSSCDELNTICNPATPTQLALLFSSFGLLSIGCGCIRPCSMAFGADQLTNHPTQNNQRLIDSYFNWYYASAAMSMVVSFTLLIYIQDEYGWQVGFAVPVLLMVCSALMFMLGSSLYVKVKVGESPFSGFIQVLVVAFKNRKVNLSRDDCYNHSHGMDRVELTENLRFLNKACIIKDSNTDPWNLSTVEKVESLKSLIRIAPIWSSGILLFTTSSQSYPTLQAKTMNRNIISGIEIPAASFVLFLVLTLTIWIAFYDRILVPILTKHTLQPRGLHPKTRMGIGLVISFVAMVVSGIVETIRRHMARSGNDMSAMWLVPQYSLLGLAEAFNAIGQLEFYYSELPKSMSSIAVALFMVSNAFSGLFGSFLINVVDSVTREGGNVSWLSSDINEGHVDYYYWLLGFLSLLNFFYFLVCCRLHRIFSLST